MKIKTCFNLNLKFTNLIPNKHIGTKNKQLNANIKALIEQEEIVRNLFFLKKGNDVN